MAWSVQGNLKGPPGDKGDKGDKGDTGADGTGVTILGSYPTEAALIAAHPTGDPGDAYLVAGDLYVWDAANSQWNNVGTIKGPKGDKGDQGDVGAPGPAGEDSTVPGPPGNDGAAATIEVGQVSTGAAGSAAVVSNVGTDSAAVLDFVIPRGAQGVPGTAGTNGTRWHFGTGAPATIPGSVPGDAYLDTADGTVYRLT